MTIQTQFTGARPAAPILRTQHPAPVQLAEQRTVQAPVQAAAAIHPTALPAAKVPAQDALDAPLAGLDQSLERASSSGLMRRASSLQMPKALKEQIETIQINRHPELYTELSEVTAAKALSALDKHLDNNQALMSETRDPALGKNIQKWESPTLADAFKVFVPKLVQRQDLIAGPAKQLVNKSAAQAAAQWVEKLQGSSLEAAALSVKSYPEIQQDLALAVIASKPKYQQDWQALQARHAQRNDGSQPNPMEVISKDKQKLVTAMTEGIWHAQQPNRVTAWEDRSMIVHSVNHTYAAPQEMTLNGQTYTYSRDLHAGGKGATFLMTGPNAQQVVVKAMLTDEYDQPEPYERPQTTAFKDAHAEAKAHLHAVNGGTSPDVVGFIGAVAHTHQGFRAMMLVTEYAPGGDLNGMLAKINNSNASPSEKNAMKHLLMRDMVQGMQHLADDRNLAHYDLKPGNLFINAQGRVMIGDFGSAQRSHRDTDTLVAFTDQYQALGPISEKSDIYSMGLIIKEVLFGAAPTSNLERRRQQATYKVDTYDAYNQLVDHMTDPDPAKRPNLPAVLSHPLFAEPIAHEAERRQQIIALINQPA